MDICRVPQTVLKLILKGRRNFGCLKKGWSVQWKQNRLCYLPDGVLPFIITGESSHRGVFLTWQQHWPLPYYESAVPMFEPQVDPSCGSWNMYHFRDENRSVPTPTQHPPSPSIHPTTKLENTENTSKCQPAVTFLDPLLQEFTREFWHRI